MTNKKMKFVPSILKDFDYLNSHIRLNKMYMNPKSNNNIYRKLDITFSISHFEYEIYLLKEILKKLRHCKKELTKNL